MIRIIVTTVKEIGSLIALPLIYDSIEQLINRRKPRIQNNMQEMNDRQKTEVAKTIVLKMIKELLPKKEAVNSRLSFFDELNAEEQILSSVAIQATDIVESLRDFVDCIEGVDSYLSSFEDLTGDVGVRTKEKIINSIIKDSLKLGGFGYDVKVKSLES